MQILQQKNIFLHFFAKIRAKIRAKILAKILAKIRAKILAKIRAKSLPIPIFALPLHHLTKTR